MRVRNIVGKRRWDILPSLYDLLEGLPYTYEAQMPWLCTPHDHPVLKELPSGYLCILEDSICSVG
jgi:hypothetical protein